MQELGKQVRIWGRNQDALKQLALQFDISIENQFSEATKADVVISTLPALALDEHLTTLANEPTNVLLDVAYSPWPSLAANVWSRRGKVISGLDMLIWQAVAQQRLFAGNAVEEELADEKELVAVIRGALSMAK
jgi:shikimate dehydrogenase